LEHLRSLRDIILSLIAWTYKPFKKIVPEETFRYAVCGGSNTALDISLYFVCYNFVLRKQLLNLGFFAIKPHIASFMIVFPITFTSGFLLAKYITFTQSALRGRIQLFRYGVTVFICILLNYVFLKLFVEYFGLFPTPSKILTSGLVVIYSYFSQKHYTFKKHKEIN
jgi:Predicted membrane protein